MKFVNETRFETRELRAIFARACAEVRRAERRKLPLQTVRFFVGGTVTLTPSAGRLDIGIPAQTDAKTAAIQSLVGAWFSVGRHSPIEPSEWAWAAAMPLTHKRPRAKRPADIRVKRLRLALAGRRRWESKQRRAENALKKLNAKIKRLKGALEKEGVL